MVLDWLEAVVLGVVQGLTEFLPVSSDGHLSITQQLFARLRGASSSGKDNLLFIVILHLGTLASILVHYRHVGMASTRGVLGLEPIPVGYSRARVLRVVLLTAIATLPAVVVGLTVKDRIEELFGSPSAAAAGFLVTAVVLLVSTRFPEGRIGPDETTWKQALLIGLAQAVAPLPGVSRSGLTIAAALALGFRRTWAVGFSLAMAVVAILGAMVLELKDASIAGLDPSWVQRAAVGTLISGIVGYAAIVWLLKVVRHGRLWYFSGYLLVLALAVWFGLA